MNKIWESRRGMTVLRPADLMDWVEIVVKVISVSVIVMLFRWSFGSALVV